MMDDEDLIELFDEHTWTEQGKMHMLAILSEFCHGFTVEEIAKNNPDLDVEEIRVFVAMLARKAGLI